MRHYLSVGAIYFDETTYLREWIAFHRIVGVEKFFLYDNGNADDHLEVLAPYLDDGTVVVHEWPMRPGQMPAYDHCLRTYEGESRWIAFLDLDEFLFSPTYRPLPEILVDYERHPAVAVNWAMFGTSGHRARPPGLTIETHDYRKEYPEFEQIKCIVNPRRTERALSPHAFAYRDGFAVNERHIPIEKRPLGMSGPVSVERRVSTTTPSGPRRSTSRRCRVRRRTAARSSPSLRTRSNVASGGRTPFQTTRSRPTYPPFARPCFASRRQRRRAAPIRRRLPGPEHRNPWTAQTSSRRFRSS